MRSSHLFPVALIAVACLLHPGTSAEPQQDASAIDQARDTRAREDDWDVTKPRGVTREIDFTTTEGTWTSVDLSPDGTWIAFDLLGHIYRVPSTGGDATCLTQDSGVALNFHPRISPDGKTIAFVSDRKGQNNLWLMDIDGRNPRPVSLNKDVRVFEPAWTPDGRNLIVRRTSVARDAGPAAGGIFMYSREGGEGIRIVPENFRGAASPSISADGKHLYFQVNTGGQGVWSGRADVMQGARQLRRMDMATGQVVEITSGELVQQYQGSSGGAIAPEVSPDGRWLAFARRIPDGTITWKRHSYGPRTALWLRDLQTGAERIVMDPIEQDQAEGMKVSRDLPGYVWARDSKSIVLSQGGKIRRLDVASGQVATIPFSARVHRTISEQAYADQEWNDTSFVIKFPRWTAASPDGRRLAFQAAGRVWVMDLPSGTPRRLTDASFEPLEMSPSWSPDGSRIAFASWADKEMGHIFIVDAGGGQPRQITKQAGEYLNTLWTPDGQQIVMSRGAGATAAGRTVSNNLYYELVRVPAAGGDVSAITTVNRPYAAGRPLMPRRPIVQASIGTDGRLYYPETSGPGEGENREFTEIKSIKLDGSDARVHLRFPYADEAVVSPDGRWLAFQEGDNVYLMAFPAGGMGAATVRIDKRRGQLNVVPVTTQGGNYPRWRNNSTLEFVSGPQFDTYNTDTKKLDTFPIRLELPRRFAKGSIALTGARIITLEDRRVIEKGTIVVRDGRIACVGNCATAGVSKVVDVKSKTIIPGLIDMHAHHHRDHEGVLPRQNWESAIYMAHGVTTTLDNSMWSHNVFPTAEMIEAGVTIGPRSFSTGDPLYSGDASRQNEITSYEVAEQNIARLQSWGAITVKQYMQPRRDQRQWVTDVARKRQMRVTAEGGDLEYDLSMIMDGHTGWEHPLSYAPLYSDAAKFFGLAKAVYSVTFLVGGSGPWNEEFFYQDSDVWKDERLRRWTPWRMLIPGTRRRMLRPATDYSYPMLAQGLADIISNGGYGAIGSHGQQHGLGSHWEVWAAASALGPMGALEVASVHGAHFLGLGKHLGSISQGKLADIVVLDANPLENIRHTKEVRYVMKAGVLYDAMTLDEIWPVEKPFGTPYWNDPNVLRTDSRGVDYWDQKTATPTSTAGKEARKLDRQH
ncbi:MAG TPA: amidohydrolase family protein [Vicinamibacterales bacterium]|jgi:Tol biopolymer transport system component/imidazolonepropionase-like amidohydrolase|nr:amidohydrolase family protein [Vicinamibacterales bacterium]